MKFWIRRTELDWIRFLVKCTLVIFVLFFLLLCTIYWSILKIVNSKTLRIWSTSPVVKNTHIFPGCCSCEELERLCPAVNQPWHTDCSTVSPCTPINTQTIISPVIRAVCVCRCKVKSREFIKIHRKEQKHSAGICKNFTFLNGC